MEVYLDEATPSLTTCTSGGPALPAARLAEDLFAAVALPAALLAAKATRRQEESDMQDVATSSRDAHTRQADDSQRRERCLLCMRVRYVWVCVCMCLLSVHVFSVRLERRAQNGVCTRCMFFSTTVRASLWVSFIGHPRRANCAHYPRSAIAPPVSLISIFCL